MESNNVCTAQLCNVCAAMTSMSCKTKLTHSFETLILFAKFATTYYIRVGFADQTASATYSYFQRRGISAETDAAMLLHHKTQM